MPDPGPMLRFLVCRRAPDGARSILGACPRMADAELVVTTLTGRRDGMQHWIEEDDGAQPGNWTWLLAMPSLDVISRGIAPPVRFGMNPPWTSEPPMPDQPESLRFACPRSTSEAAAEMVISGLELDRAVPFDAYVEHFWSHRRMGNRKYVSQDLIKGHFAERPARGYDWGTGVSEIFAWLIQVDAKLLVWAACEVEHPRPSREARDARQRSHEMLSKIEFLERG